MEEEKKTSYIIRIGPKLREVLDKQKHQIAEATYDCVDPSDFQAGEIIAKKVLGEI